MVAIYNIIAYDSLVIWVHFSDKGKSFCGTRAKLIVFRKKQRFSVRKRLYLNFIAVQS